MPFAMKIRHYWPLCFLLFFSTVLVAPACSKKSGCPAESSLQAPKKSKKSKRQEGLMPKKMRKKVGG
jgi:hypothetical protein